MIFPHSPSHTPSLFFLVNRSLSKIILNCLAKSTLLSNIGGSHHSLWHPCLPTPSYDAQYILLRCLPTAVTSYKNCPAEVAPPSQSFLFSSGHDRPPTSQSSAGIHLFLHTFYLNDQFLSAHLPEFLGSRGYTVSPGLGRLP